MPTNRRQEDGRSQYRFKTSYGRTSNDAEAELAEKLENDGWLVMKRGWPDFLALKDGQLRLIEVKPKETYRLSKHQQQLAEILRKHAGLNVERWYPGKPIN